MKAAVIGAGMTGRAVAYDLVRQDDVDELLLVDADSGRLSRLKRWLGSGKVRIARQDVNDSRAMTRLMRRVDVAVSCVSFRYNLGLTRAAIRSRTSLCDLGGNNDVVRSQLGLNRQAAQAGIGVVPDCGLAPGLVGILAADGCARLDRTEAIRIRVGGLPRKPKPPLGYRIVFSAHGLINEYAEPCVVLRNRRVKRVPPLDDIEHIRFPVPFGRLEAFNTSGGSSTLPYTYRGRVRTLDYKTIRHPGHCERVRLLLELGLAGNEPIEVRGCRVVPRELLVRLLESGLGYERDDVVLLRVDVSGWAGRHQRRVRYQLVDYADKRRGLTAMMRCTGFPASVVGLMLGRGRIRQPGVWTGESGIPAAALIRELRARGVRIRVRGRAV